MVFTFDLLTAHAIDIWHIVA